MGDPNPVVLAASQAVAEGGKGGSNFLVPNGTFFVVLAIFLIVLAVIGTFVVPPITRVLRERDAMVHKTQADNKKSSEQFEAAEVLHPRVPRLDAPPRAALPKLFPPKLLWIW